MGVQRRCCSERKAGAGQPHRAAAEYKAQQWKSGAQQHQGRQHGAGRAREVGSAECALPVASQACARVQEAVPILRYETSMELREHDMHDYPRTLPRCRDLLNMGEQGALCRGGPEHSVGLPSEGELLFLKKVCAMCGKEKCVTPAL
ncbi:hypothetical protein NDU88_005092 [Pleurodeles waltl]|uniref:Uncharacterized protein n=1 Tax=Pleurodeles waltl TaxID=8319 RepID=A0AAV7T9P9_PLEWA|nr:hypothetical protein NDU88_005092 [Pleurodeles waltl]